MCGIYITNIPYQKEEIQTKLKKIEFRGPNNLGITQVNGVLLGHLRLAVLDLDKRSNQPYHYEHLYITYNGEIYNFESIREELIALGFSFETTSDTEVLIKGYSIWGKGLLSRLNGMFAFAIYDSIRNEIFCARDRLGVKPFFYYWKDGRFEVCSQLSPLMRESLIINDEAISIYMACGYIPSPLSIYEDILKLQPGYSLLVDLKSKAIKLEKYWDLEKAVVNEDLSYDEAKEELHRLITDAVKIRMQSDVPLGSFLSGGIDSALVSAIAAKNSKQSLKTFTIAFENPKYDESKVAEQYSEIIKSEHTATLCTSKDVLDMLPYLTKVYDEPFADSSALPSLLLNKVTKENVTVALSGDGGDESFIGYEHFSTINKFVKLAKVPFLIRKIFSAILPNSSKYKYIFSLKDENDFIVRIFINDQNLVNNKNNKWIDKYYSSYKKLSENSIQKAADLNIKLWLENDSNVKVDRASMAFSVESRSPFLDYRIVEFARTLPVDYRFENGVTKRILRDILKEYIPQEVFTQPKKGFAVPVGEWLRTELKEDVCSKLTDEFLYAVPNLNVKKFKKQFKLHLEGKYDYSFNVWKLYVLALWHEKFNYGRTMIGQR